MSPTGVERLRQYRDRHGYKAYELAELLGLAEAHLSQIFHEKRVPGLATAVRIEDLTGIPVRAWVASARGKRAKKTNRDRAKQAAISVS